MIFEDAVFLDAGLAILGWTSFGKVHDLPQIEGVRFCWNVAHRNLLSESVSTIERPELLVPMEVLKDLTEGNLSGFELVQKSILSADGNKITLTSYEPIGAR